MNGLDRLGQRIASEQDALRARTGDRAIVRERLGAMQLPRAARALPRIGVAIACASAVAALLWLWVRPLGPEPLTLAVGRSGKPTAVGTWIEAPKRDSLLLRFSDGTHIEMAPGSRARVVALETAGAHLLLESGQARVEVVRRPHASWRLSVGPFAVRVTGTRFDVRWNPEQDSFELDLEEGHVEVSGCVFGRGYGMAAGQKVDASCGRRRFNVSDRRMAEDKAAPSSPPPRAPSLEIAPASKAPEKKRAGWRESAERGKYAAAYVAAKAAGFESTCGRADADALAMLGDAARYAHEPEDEAYALRLLRRRFTGTPRAALAAFALGRLEFDVHRSYEKAGEWFVTYLREQPGGPLTREARGRLIEATLGSGDRDGARKLAHRYLRDYPDGPHAELAHSLLNGN